MNDLTFGKWTICGYCFMRKSDPVKIIGVVRKTGNTWTASNAYCKHETTGSKRHNA